MRVALGWKAHSGWAALVAVGGDLGDPRVVERSRVELVAAGSEEWAKQPYHAAEGLEPDDAREVVERGVNSARRLAAEAMRAAERRCSAGSREVCGCAVLVGRGMPSWSVHEILAVHFRMHHAEGELFRDALVAGAHACGLALTTLPDKAALDAAARALGVSRARLDGTLANLGKAVGSPWGKDQKEAAAAALVAIERSGIRAPRETRPRA